MEKKRIREIANDMVAKMIKNIYGHFSVSDNMPFFYEHEFDHKSISNSKISRVQPYLYQLDGQIYIAFGVVDEVINMGKKRKNKYNILVSCNAEIVADQLRALYVEIYQKKLYKDHPDCHWYDDVKSVADVKKIYGALFHAFLEIFRGDNEYGITEIDDNIALSLMNPIFNFNDEIYVYNRGRYARTYVTEGLEIDKSHQTMYDVLLK